MLRGKGLFQPVDFRPPFEEADPEYPLVLSTGRTLYHYNAATQTRRSEGLSGKQPESFVEVHRRDARKLGIEMGRVVSNVERYGNTSSTSIPLALSEAARQGRFRDGDLIALVGFGGGLTWGTALLQW